jgi:hypothetical protein
MTAVLCTSQKRSSIAAKWPSARIGTIEVRPIEEELRMDRRYAIPGE